MGCDYYIIKQLEVRHINDDDEEEVSYIELERDRCYFYDEPDSQDSDDSTDSESYNTQFHRKYDKYLEVTYQPRILFQNNKWKSEKVQDKYEDIIRNEINNDMLVKIIKQEVRYFR